MLKIWLKFVEYIGDTFLLGPETVPREGLEMQHLLKSGDKIREENVWYTVLRALPHSSTIIVIERAEPIVTKSSSKNLAYRLRSDAAMMSVNLLVGIMACIVAIVGVIISIYQRNS